jgi:hypothetical protein
MKTTKIEKLTSENVDVFSFLERTDIPPDVKTRVREAGGTELGSDLGIVQAYRT